MKKMIFILLVVIVQSGCTMAPKVKAVRYAADEGMFTGLDENSKFSVSYPGDHSGPYGAIDQLNFKIEDGQYQGKKASAIIGKSRSTGLWEVLMILVNDNGQWSSVPKAD